MRRFQPDSVALLGGAVLAACALVTVSFYRAPGSYQASSEGATISAPVFESRDCSVWKSIPLTSKTATKRSAVQFLSESEDGKGAMALEGGPKPLVMGNKSAYYKVESTVYALLGGRIRIKRANPQGFLTDVRQVADRKDLLLDANYAPDASVNVQFYERGRLYASCRAKNQSVNCVDSALNAKTWQEVVKTSYEPAVALNILCNRVTDLRSRMDVLKHEATKMCPAGKFEVATDVRAICPHIPEI